MRRVRETRTIWVTWKFPGFHSYPSAPSPVRYLASKHRHIFGVRVELEVDVDLDRELEFHMIKNQLMVQFYNRLDDQDTGSCESMCSILADIVRVNYPTRSFSITVDEDNECGSTFVSETVSVL